MTTFVQIIMFVLFALVVLFGGHYLFYFSAVKFFSIESLLYKRVLVYVVVFLSLSFIFSTFLARFGDFFLSRILYFVSSFWLGFLFYFLMAAGAVWLIIWTTGFLGLNLSRPALAVALFAVALLVSLAGLWNAFNPKVKNISVDIPNLPDAWKDKIIVQLSDAHLGAIHGENFIHGVIEKVNSLEPDMVLITGDFFDGADSNVNIFASSLNDINAKNGVYFVTGNHETYLGVEGIFELLKNTKVKVLNDEVVDVDGLKLIGVSYPDRVGVKDIVSVVKSLQEEFYGEPNILMYHSPVSMAQFKELGVNLQLSGHTHAGQVFPVGYISKLIYGDYYYGLHKEGDFTIYTTSGVGTWGPPIRTGYGSEIVVITLH